MEGVRVVVMLEPARIPVRGCRVVLGPGLDAITDGAGVATFARLEAGRYLTGLSDLPPHVEQATPRELAVAPDAFEFEIRARPAWPLGTLVLLGDSDSAEDQPWRRTSVDDHLDELAGLLGWASYPHENLAQPCTSASDTQCPHVAIEQVHRIPSGTRIAILRFGLNDLHYYGVMPGSVDRFRAAYAQVVDQVLASGAHPVLVAIQEEELEVYRGPRAGFNAAIQDLARSRGGTFVDPGLSWDRDRYAFDRDGVHLDDDGMQAVAAAIVDQMRVELTSGARAR